MRRLLHLAVAAAILLGGTIVLAAPASAVIFCNGVLTGTINELVIVSSGATCKISNATVNAAVNVQPGGKLFIEGSTINGNVSGNQAEWIRIDALGPCTVAGDPNSCVRRTIINGSVSFTGTTGAPPPGEPPANYICNGTTITGSVTITNSGPNAPWNIGASPLCSFGGNNLGPLTVDNNDARVDIRQNTVNGTGSVTNNTGGGDVSGNTFSGSLSVQNNCPPYTVNQPPGTVGGTTSINQPCENSTNNSH